MALTREQSLLWQAMDIGPQWLLRSSEDPLLASEAPQTGVKAQAAVPVARARQISSAGCLEIPLS